MHRSTNSSEWRRRDSFGGWGHYRECIGQQILRVKTPRIHRGLGSLTRPQTALSTATASATGLNLPRTMRMPKVLQKVWVYNPKASLQVCCKPWQYYKFMLLDHCHYVFSHAIVFVLTQMPFFLISLSSPLCLTMFTCRQTRSAEFIEWFGRLLRGGRNRVLHSQGWVVCEHSISLLPKV